MPTSIELPNCSVAIVNRGQVTLTMVYAQTEYQYLKGGRPKIVPFAVAHKHFGFELRGGRLYRNTDQFYPGGNDETAYYVARATFLPWGWEKLSRRDNFEHIFNQDDDPKNQITKAQMFRLIKDTWENKIEARLVSVPAEMNVEQFEALPA